MTRVWSPEADAALIEMWPTSMTRIEISVELEDYGLIDMPANAITRRVKQLGLPLRTFDRHWTADIDRVLRDAMQQNPVHIYAQQRLRRAGYRFGIKAVRDRCHRLGLQSRHANKRWPKPMSDRALQMARDGHSFNVIATRLGVTKGAIAGRIWRLRRQQKLSRQKPYTPTATMETSDAS